MSAIDGYASSYQDYLETQRKLSALLEPPPAIASFLEKQEQIAAAYQEPLANLACSVAAVSASFQPVALQVAETLSATQEAIRAAAQPLVGLRAAYWSDSVAGGTLAQAREHLRALRETEASYARDLPRMVSQATAALTLAQQIRVRNAAVHWTPDTGPLSPDPQNLALVVDEISKWAADGSRRLRSFAAIAAGALARGAFELFASITRRATALALPSGETSSPVPPREHRVAERLRLIRASLNPHAPPFCPA